MMRELNSFPLLFTFALLLLTPNLAAAMLDAKTADISYQVNNSDRVVIGTVSGIDVYDTYTIYTITVNEWLYNPLPSGENSIKVKSRVGSHLSVEDEAEFTKNESVLLMLQNGDQKNQTYHVTFGFLGKHLVSDRGAVMKALKAQGKIEIETQPANETIVGYPAIITETQKPTSNPQLLEELEKENTTKNTTENTTVYIDKAPFVRPVWVVAIMLIAIIYARRQK